jgi:hypothetical protein
MILGKVAGYKTRKSTSGGRFALCDRVTPSYFAFQRVGFRAHEAGY